jgi:glucose-1-phosphate cytidylyltransferase
MIKEYFANYLLHMSDVTFDMQKRSREVHQSVAEPWKVTLVDTGDQTGTGGRLKKVARYIEGEDPFCMTYGDGVSDIDISASVAFHKQHGGNGHHFVSGEATGGGRMDQWWFLCVVTESAR